MSDLQTSSSVPPKKRGAPFGNTNAAAHPPSADPDAEPSPKRGAPYGNINGLTHGFYSRCLPAASLEGLEETGANSLKDEIEVMRVFARKVAELGAEVQDLEAAKSLLHILSIATSAINRLVRTHVHIPDPSKDPAALLSQTLLELEDEWPEFKELVKEYPHYMQDPNHPLHPSHDVPRVWPIPPLGGDSEPDDV